MHVGQYVRRTHSNRTRFSMQFKWRLYLYTINIELRDCTKKIITFSNRLRWPLAMFYSLFSELGGITVKSTYSTYICEVQMHFQIKINFFRVIIWSSVDNLNVGDSLIPRKLHCIRFRLNSRALQFMFRISS